MYNIVRRCVLVVCRQLRKFRMYRNLSSLNFRMSSSYVYRLYNVIRSLLFGPFLLSNQGAIPEFVAKNRWKSKPQGIYCGGGSVWE